MLNRGKLTTKLFMNLQRGALMSNVCFKKGVPVYASWVTPLLQREKQWKAIVDLAVDQRLCYVFKNKEAAKKWQAGTFLIEK